LKNYFSLSEIQKDIQSGTVSCALLVDYYLKRIEEKKHLNAFLEVFADEAKIRAQEIDAKIKNGTAGKLAGMVIGIKDVLSYKDHKVSSSSQILKGYTSIYTATAVQKLLDEDVIIIGRQNCDEFAMGSSNENSSYGNVLNPIDETRVPGGSSGGGSAAVAADLCQASIGSDTGGSVRQPASFCGVVGYKPTYSRISRYGLLAYASSFDVIGPMTKSVADAAILTQIMAGEDEFDSTVSQKPVGDYLSFDTQKKYKIAVIKECLENDGIDSEIKNITLNAIKKLSEAGHSIEYVSFPYLDYMVPTYYIITTAEASSNLGRYDGIRYGHRTSENVNLENLYKKSRTEGFGKEVKRRIMLGTFVLSASYYDAYFTKAQQVRRVIKEKTEDILKNYDFIISPTTPTTAFEIGGKSKDPIAMYLSDIYTVQSSLSGIPAISVPIGSDSKGLPAGLHITSEAFSEPKIFDFAYTIENLLKN
jgi:aspartyl-tRNA(Asn)/glutamyl-tRNA(Gln) amidotransferase subunit A